MASTTELRKSYLETAKTLTTKPLYAWAGAGDLAVEKLREVPQKVSKINVGKLKPEVSIEETKQFVSDVPGKISAKVNALPKSPKELQAKLPSAKDLASKIPSAKSLQTKLTEATEAQVKAVDAKFDELADRGELVVKRIRSQKTTTDLVSQAKTTVAKAKAVPTTAARSTRPATAAAKNTVTAVKSTATAARKTAVKAAPAVKTAPAATAAKTDDQA